MTARWITALVLLAGLWLTTGEALAGAYTLTQQTNPSPDRITHPMGYGGVGGSFDITICVDPSSAADEPNLAIPLANVARTWTARVATSPNLVFANFFDPNADNTNVPFNDYDLESVALHEFGHCLGLGHSNKGGGFSPDDEFTMSEGGTDPNFQFDDGVDNVDGSADDQRDDDVNLVWFFKSTNNPFTVFGSGQIIDSTTFSRQLADLPGGDSYPTGGSRDVAALLGSSDTESVMNQGTPNGEEQRTLGADDVASIRFAMSGTDEIEGTGDDYIYTMSYIGIASSCDIRVEMTTATGFARCIYSFPGNMTTDHETLISGSALVQFNPTFSWFFNDVSNGTEPIPVFGDGPAIVLLALLLLGVLALATLRRA